MLERLSRLRESREEGFTLIELLVVIVIIGVLAAIALPIFLNQQRAANQAVTKQTVRNAVIEIRTMLVKNPKASYQDELQAGGPPVGPWATLQDKYFNTGPSDVQVVFGRSNQPISDTFTVGTYSWDNWIAIGYEKGQRYPDVNWAFKYDSTTGKYTTLG